MNHIQIVMIQSELTLIIYSLNFLLPFLFISLNYSNKLFKTNDIMFISSFKTYMQSISITKFYSHCQKKYFFIKNY